MDYPQFIDYKDLPNYGECVNAIQLHIETTNYILNSTDIRELLNGILILRKLRKYKYTIFAITFNNMIDLFVDKYLKKDQDFIVLEHTLRFIHEILFEPTEYERKEPIKGDWYTIMFSKLYNIFKNETNTKIKSFAQNILQEYMVNSFNSDAIEKCLEALMLTNDENEFNFWVDSMKRLINDNDSFTLINEIDWGNVMIGLNKVSKENEINNKNYDIIIYFFNSLKSKASDDDWNNITNEFSNKPDTFFKKIL